MAMPRLTSRANGWAPRALAVISCALALLAVQPVGAGSPRSATATVSEAVVGRDGTAGISATRATPEHPAHLRGRRTISAGRCQSLLGEARQLHILATVEILQRLLWAEWRGLEPSGGCEVCWFEPQPALLVCDLGLQRKGLAPGSGASVPPAVERQYAIERFLLAPPRL